MYLVVGRQEDALRALAEAEELKVDAARFLDQPFVLGAVRLDRARILFSVGEVLALGWDVDVVEEAFDRIRGIRYLE